MQCWPNPPRGGGALNFHFGIWVRPKGPNWGACERITTEFGTLVNWVSEQNSLVNWIFVQIEALERNSFPILRLWSLKIIEICHVRDESRGLRTEKRVLKWGSSDRREGLKKGVFRAAHTRTPFSVSASPGDPTYHYRCYTISLKPYHGVKEGWRY